MDLVSGVCGSVRFEVLLVCVHFICCLLSVFSFCSVLFCVILVILNGIRDVLLLFVM